MALVRKIDGVGRVSFPKEARENLGINPGDPMEIFVDGEKLVLIKKKEQTNCIKCGTVSEEAFEMAQLIEEARIDKVELLKLIREIVDRK